MIEGFALIKRITKIFGKFNVLRTVAVYSELKILLQPFEGFGLPLHFDIHVVDALGDFAFNVGVTILSGDFVANESTPIQTTLPARLDHESRAVSVLIFGSSGEEPLTELGDAESVLA